MLFISLDIFQKQVKYLNKNLGQHLKAWWVSSKKSKTSCPFHSLKLCYEATYLGYSLQRDLSINNHDCVVIAPSSIPKVHDNQIKTDKIDAGNLAQFYAAGVLTIVTVPWFFGE